MASQQLTATRAAHAARMADTRKAAEIARRFTGWAVWSSRDGRQRLATRTGNQRNPGDDGWEATLIADTWTDLEHQLAAQAKRDAARAQRQAELTYPELQP